MGGRTNFRLAESIPAIAGALLKAGDIHEAFLSLGCAVICWRFLRADWMMGLKPGRMRVFVQRDAMMRLNASASKRFRNKV